jgi:hypothetical protein
MNGKLFHWLATMSAPTAEIRSAAADTCLRIAWTARQRAQDQRHVEACAIASQLVGA